VSRRLRSQGVPQNRPCRCERDEPDRSIDQRGFRSRPGLVLRFRAHALQSCRCGVEGFPRGDEIGSTCPSNVLDPLPATSRRAPPGASDSPRSRSGARPRARPHCRSHGRPRPEPGSLTRERAGALVASSSEDLGDLHEADVLSAHIHLSYLDRCTGSRRHAWARMGGRNAYIAGRFDVVFEGVA
jgi:hypothetical protein